MAGTLTINSSGDGSLTSGHSWIEYQKDGDSESTTYGTWGNDPSGLGNGLHENLEKGRVGDASRSLHINDEQEKRLFATIKQYKDKGADGWQYLNPCSGFAADAWHSATGEDLSHRSWGISNPSTLKASIEKANKAAAEAGKSPKATRTSSSRRKVRDGAQPCSAGSSGRK